MTVYILHDNPYSKPKFLEIINALEWLGLKVVSWTNDLAQRIWLYEMIYVTNILGNLLFIGTTFWNV